MTGKRLSSGEAVDRLVTLAQSTFTDNLSSQEKEGFDRLAKVMHTGKRSPRMRWFVLGLCFSAAVALVPIILALVHKPQHISFKVTGGSPSAEGFENPVEDPQAAGRIDFSDGSFVALEPKARASVTDIDERGAHIRLECGKLHTHFVPHQGARWSVDAGPYLVTVTGTTFEIAWTPSERAMEIWLREGSAVIKGPLADPGINMTAGQHIRANILDGQVLLDRLDQVDWLDKISETVEMAEPEPPKAQRSLTRQVPRRK